MESQNENYGNQNHHDEKDHGDQEPLAIPRSTPWRFQKRTQENSMTTSTKEVS